ncbi:MFS transporter [Salinimonas lutimaris]|uniref:MFS transporter n=1 Tax=Salinimonas lutimaris TaxID=914153 RepID=UPI001E3D621B|nr:MFS transporter [Salinimonas lutimaris]
MSTRFSTGFYAFLVGRGLFSLIDSIVGTAVAWHLYITTRDPFDLALVGLFMIAPVYLFFVVTGWVADHVSRKRVLQVGALAWLVILAGIAWQMQSGEFNKWILLLMLSGLGTVKAFLSPSLQAIVPNLVPAERISAAVALTGTVWNLAMTMGPFIAGMLISWLDYTLYWVAVGICVLISGCFLLLPAIGPANTGTQRSKRALWQGFSFLQNNSLVLGSLLLDVLIVLGGSVVALLPVYAADILEVGPQGLGLMRAMPAIGAVLVGLYLSRYKNDFDQAGHTLFRALLIFAVSVLGFALADSLWLACVCLFVYGASDMFSVVIRGAVVQHNTPDALRGRVGALNSLFISTSNQLGDFRAGSVAAALGPVNAAFIGACTAFAVVGWGYWRFPKLAAMTSTNYQQNRHSA